MADHPPRPGYRFPAPVPKEALEYFRLRAPKVGFDYRDVWLQEHAHAFTVAKAMEVEILMDIREALSKAIAEGRTLAQFRKDLTPLLQRRGWWGKKVMTDPLTGKQVVAQLGSPRRLRTIYRANLRAARAAGVWQRAQRTKWGHPYFLYQLGPSKEHRKEHSDWAGTLLPVDDPWWNDHFPPNGWGCKCSVRQVSRREAGRRGGPTSRPARNPEERVNRRTREVQIVDKGIDPAWASNPGKARGRILMENLNGKIERADYDLARSTVGSIVRSPILDNFQNQVAAYDRAHPEARRNKGPGEPISIPQEEIKDRIGEVFVSLLGRRGRTDLPIPGGAQFTLPRPVRLSPETALKQLKHSETKKGGKARPLTIEDYRRLPDIIDGGEAFVTGDRKIEIFRKIADRLYAVVVKQTDDYRIYLTTFHHAKTRDRNRAKRQAEQRTNSK